MSITNAEFINEYISRCEQAIADNNREELKNLQNEIISVFAARIDGIRDGLDNYSYGWIGNGKVVDYLGDLKKLKEKLRLHLIDSETKPSNKIAPLVQINNANSLQSNINVEISITFEQARQAIHDMESLSAADTQVALGKLDELLEIAKSKESKKGKWAKISGIFKWLAEKTADLAIAFMPVIFQTITDRGSV